MSNDHLRNTHTFLNEATDGTVWSPEQQPTVATLAVAEATLALAYEQRTANLIAYATSIDDTDAAAFALIKERLDRPEPPKPAPVEHYRVGAGRCNCGFDAYRISGIMIDYSEELAIHLRGNR